MAGVEDGLDALHVVEFLHFVHNVLFYLWVKLNVPFLIQVRYINLL